MVALEDGFQNEWLGGRDSNPDRQIQSLSRAADAKGNQQLSPANSGQVGRNPQPPCNLTSPPELKLRDPEGGDQGGEE